MAFPREKQHGFTLIELMITVGILGILVSLTLPRYERYQRKAMQAEAKLGAASVYSLEKSFYSEYNAYIPSLGAIGYSPEGLRRLYYHQICHSDTWTGNVTGYPNPWDGVRQLNALNSPYTYLALFTSGTCPIPAWFPCSGYGNDPQSFNASFVGQLKNGGQTDAWIINENKILSNCNEGI